MLFGVNIHRAKIRRLAAVGLVNLAMVLATSSCSKKISPNNADPFPDLHVASVSPVDGAANVSANADIVLTFSASIVLENLGFMLAPMPPDFYAILQQSSDGKQVIVRTALQPNTTYSMVVFLAKDRFDDFLRTPFNSRFTTASSLPSVTVSGKTISPFNQPLQGFVGLLIRNLQSILDAANPDQEFQTSLAAVSAIRDTSGDFELAGVTPGAYWPFTALDVNRDGRFSLASGDRIQGYDANADLSADSVAVATSSISGIQIGLTVVGMRVQSTSPLDGATNVPLATNFRITFTAPVDTSVLGLFIAPIPEGLSTSNLTLSPDGRELSAAVTLRENTAYTAVLYAARSTRGQQLQTPVQVRFTTGAQFPSGEVRGNAVFLPGAGTPGSALVGLLNTSLGSVLIRVLTGEDPTEVLRSSLVALSFVPNDDGAYVISNVPDGVYWPAGAKDLDMDGSLEPAPPSSPVEPIGFYTIGPDTSILSADSLVVSNGQKIDGITIRFQKLF